MSGTSAASKTVKYVTTQRNVRSKRTSSIQPNTNTDALRVSFFGVLSLDRAHFYMTLILSKTCTQRRNISVEQGRNMN